jgi:predicted dehydrogenase
VSLVRIGIVGAGYIAGRHVDALSTLDDVRVVAVTDPQRDRAERLAARAAAGRPDGGPAPRVCDDAAAVLDAGVDGLYLCVPPAEHGPLEEDALGRGVPILVEKPLATDLPTAERIAARVAATGTPAAVGYHWRYLDTVERAAELLVTAPPRLVVGAWLDKAPGTPWWPWRERSGGQLVEQVTHLFDVARLLAGEVADVQTFGTRAPEGPGDVLHATAAAVRFERGAVGSFTSTCLLRRGYRIGIEFHAAGLSVALTERDLTVDDGSGPVLTPAAVDPFVAEDAAFVAALRGQEGTLRAPYAEALRSHRLALAVSESADRPAGLGAGR